MIMIIGEKFVTQGLGFGFLGCGCLNMCWICVMMVGGTAGLLSAVANNPPPLLHSIIAYTIHTQLICTNRWYLTQNYCTLFCSIFSNVMRQVYLEVFDLFLRAVPCEVNLSMLAHWLPKALWILLRIGRTFVEAEQLLRLLFEMP